MPDRKPNHEPVEQRASRSPQAEAAPVTGEQLQAQSQGALARLIPLMESVNMSIRQERATDETLEAACETLKEINDTFLDCQAKIRAGLPAS
jgi:hypothetical protein